MDFTPPSVAQYKDAIKKLSQAQIDVLKTFGEFDDNTATAQQLAKKLKYKGYQGANAVIGRIGKIIATHLGVQPPEYKDKKQAFYLLVGPCSEIDGKKPSNKNPGWEMQENLIKALKIK